VNTLIEFLVKELVDEPDQVSVTEITQDDASTLEVRVAPNDLGKVIGRQGRNANALRNVVKTVAMKDKRKVFVEIVA
jgi:predicted RNA-binding protein YlqC (UPF0109 family)